MKAYRISRVLILAGAVVAGSLGPVLAAGPADPAQTAPASLRATGTPTTAPTTAPTSRPFISQAEAYAIKADNAELKQEIKELRIELAKANKLAANQAQAGTRANATRGSLDVGGSGFVNGGVVGEGGRRQ